MSEYNQFPPYKYFMRVLKNCPRSAYLYFHLWKKRGKYLSLKIIKKDIRKEFLLSPTLFRNFLGPLAYLNLVSFEETDLHYEIDVLGPNLDE